MKQLVTTLFFVAIATFTYAANIIVDNMATANSANLYTSAQAAHDAANDGDVLYVRGSATSYGTLIITKRISLIGPGYFLAQNPKTQVQPSPTTFDHIKLDNGSNNSMLRGISVVRSGYGITLDSTNNILIEGCYVRCHYNIYNAYTHGVVANHSSNINISNCYISVKNANSNYYYFSAAVYGNNSTYIITNSIINNGGGSTNGYTANKVAIYSSGAIVKNCVLINLHNSMTIRGNDCILENCVLVGMSNLQSGSNNVIRNCIATNNILPTSNINQNNVAGSSIFVDYDGTLGYSTDGKWQLKSGSSAISAGYNGEDIGAFGGATPYILSGVKGPHIYSLVTAPSGSAASGLTVTVKAKVD